MAARLSSPDRGDAGAVDRLGFRPEVWVGLIDLHGSWGSKTGALAVGDAVALDTHCRGGKHLLPIHRNRVAENSVVGGDLCFHAPVGAGHEDRRSGRREETVWKSAAPARIVSQRPRNGRVGSGGPNRSLIFMMTFFQSISMWLHIDCAYCTYAAARSPPIVYVCPSVVGKVCVRSPRRRVQGPPRRERIRARTICPAAQRSSTSNPPRASSPRT